MPLPFSLSFILEHLVAGKWREKLALLREEGNPKAREIRFDLEPVTVTDARAAATAYAASSVPVIWKQGAAHTDLRRWSPAYLKRQAGDVPVKILGLPGLSDDAPWNDSVEPLGKFIAGLGRRRAYLRFSDLLDHAPALYADLPLSLLSYLAGDVPKRRINLQFFLGPRRTQTALHAEMNCNIFIQVFGRKRWVLFPTEALRRLQAPAAGKFYFFSGLDPLSLKPVKSETALRGWEIILEPGDILLCPPLLWHAAENLSTSCSIGYKYNDYRRAFSASPLLFAMNMLARNPSYPTYLWHTLIRKRHPILSST